MKKYVTLPRILMAVGVFLVLLALASMNGCASTPVKFPEKVSCPKDYSIQFMCGDYVGCTDGITPMGTYIAFEDKNGIKYLTNLECVFSRNSK